MFGGALWAFYSFTRFTFPPFSCSCKLASLPFIRCFYGNTIGSLDIFSWDFPPSDSKWVSSFPPLEPLTATISQLNMSLKLIDFSLCLIFLLNCLACRPFCLQIWTASKDIQCKVWCSVVHIIDEIVPLRTFLVDFYPPNIIIDRERSRSRW